jgi:hypothetical protein
VVVFVIPFIYGMKKIRFHHWKYIMTVLVIIFIVVIPQLYYWKFISGKWIYFAYGDERFYFSDPKILKGLFSYRKGWLVYSPIMLLALGGFFFMKGKLREIRFPLIIFILLNWYMVFSWWCWWYGGGFGARALIESYVILALPMGAALDRIWAARRWFKYGAFAIMVFLVYLNLFQVRQYRTTLLHWDSTSRELYWKVFLSHEWPENYHALLDPPDYEKAKFREE